MLRRWRQAWPRRGRFWAVPPAPVVAAPPAYVPPFTEQAGARPRWLAKTRRGVFQPVPAVYAAPAPPTGLQRPSRRPVGLRRDRPTFWTVPPAPVAAAAPVVVPTFQRSRIRPALLARRGQYLEVPPPPVVYGTGSAGGVGVGNRRGLRARRGGRFDPPWTVVTLAGPGPLVGQPARQRRRAPALPTRRAQWFEPPWPQVLLGPGPTPPAIIRATLRARGLRRPGQLFEPPWPAITPPVVTWPPATLQQARARRVGPPRRGQHFEPPWPQVTAAPGWVPPTLTRRQQRLPVAGRRRAGFAVPPAPAGVPAWVRSRPKPPPSLTRRGRFQLPSWPYVPPQPSVWRPPFRNQAGWRPRWPRLRLRRGCQFSPPWPPPPEFTWAQGATTVSPAATGTATVALGGDTGEITTGLAAVGEGSVR